MPKPYKPKKNNYAVKLIGEQKTKPAFCQEIGALKISSGGKLFAGDAGARHRKADVAVPVEPGVWRVLAVTDDVGLGPQNHAVLMVHSKAKIDEKVLTPMTPVRRGIVKAISGIAGLFLKPQSEDVVTGDDTSKEERSAISAFGYLTTRLAGLNSDTEGSRSVMTMLPSEDGVTGSLFNGLPGTARLYTDVDTRKASAKVVALVLDNRVSLV